MGKKYQKKKYFGTGVYKLRFFRRAKSSSCFVISGGQIPVNVYVTQGLAVVGERGLCFLTPAGDTL